MRKQRSESPLVLDHVENIVIDSESPPITNLHALRYLPVGMYFLAQNVRAEEIAMLRKFGGALAMVSGPGKPLVPNAFNWFSVNLTSYLRIVKLLDLMVANGWSKTDLQKKEVQREIGREGSTYVERVAPEVHLWRRKIGAHPAATQPYAEDNVATLQFSLMETVTYKGPYYKVGAFSWGTDGEKSELTEWGLTEQFERLAPRLWPQARIDPLPKIEKEKDEGTE